MNIQTAIPTPANGQAENKPGSVRRNENGSDGFETALRNKSENRFDVKAGAEKHSEVAEQLGLNLADNAGPSSIGRSTDTPLTVQVRPEDPDATVDTPIFDQVEQADTATQQVQRTERPQVPAIQNWVNQLRALDGKSEAVSVKPPAIEIAAKVQSGSPEQVFVRTDLNKQDPARQSLNRGSIEMPASHVAVVGKPVSDNPGQVRSEAAIPHHSARAKPLGGTGPQVEKVEAAPQSAVERVSGNADPVADSDVAAARTAPPGDRAAMTRKADAVAASSLPPGQSNTLNQQGGAVMPTPPVPVSAAPDGNAKTNPATGSLLNQLEQVEMVRELAASDRLGFVSRLSQNGGSVQVLRLQLKPAELGTVTAHMRMENGQMTVELIAEKDAAFRQLSKDMSVMQTAMRSMGIVVDEIVVSHGGASGDTHQTTDGQQRGTSESRGESGFGRQPGQQSNDGDTAHESGRNNASDGNNGTSSAIYI